MTAGDHTADASGSHAPPAGALVRVALALCVTLGVAARVAGCFNDLWMDEVWTHELIDGLASPLGVFTELHSWNNHHLNTLATYALGADAHEAMYRLPSLLAGLGSLYMVGLFLRRLGRLEAWVGVLLASTSYLLVHYASEARGYAPAVLFALVGLHALVGWIERPTRSGLWLFWAAVVLGACSHLGFLQFYAAAGLWSVYRLTRSGTGWGAAYDQLLRLHAPPVVALALLVHFDVRHISGGGGPSYEMSAVLVESASYAWGGPPTGAGALAIGALFLTLSAAGLLALRRRASELAPLFALVCLGGPLIAIATRPIVLFPRYFLIPTTFALLAQAVLFADLIRSGGARRIGAWVLVAGFVAGNARHVSNLIRHGRGAYAETLEFILGASEAETVTLSSDSDFRNDKLVLFYGRRLQEPERLRYVLEDEGEPAEWHVLHRFRSPVPADEVIHDLAGNRYHWVRTFPYSALSGWHWLLYRLEPR